MELIRAPIATAKRNECVIVTRRAGPRFGVTDRRLPHGTLWVPRSSDRRHVAACLAIFFARERSRAVFNSREAILRVDLGNFSIDSAACVL